MYTRRDAPSYAFNRRSDDDYLEDALEQYRYAGIPAQDFLKRALLVSDEEWESLKDLIESEAVHQTKVYQELQDNLDKKSELSENGMYAPFASMANMILERHRGLSTHRLQVLPFKTSILSASLVPEKDGGEGITARSLRWHHMLLTMHFQRKQMLERKRGRESESCGEGEQRPAKRPCHAVAPAERRCVSSAAAVPGDHSYKIELSEGEVQLARTVAKVMSNSSDRTFAFGTIISGTWIRLTYYSRTAYIISKPFDLVRDPITFSLLLILFSKQPLEKLGFDANMSYCNPFDSKAERKVKAKLDPVEGGGNGFELGPETELKLGGCIHIEHCLTGRATAVYNIERPEGCEVDLVIKFSWHGKKRRREDIAIRIARSVDPEHSPEIFGQAILADETPTKGLISACPPIDGHHPSEPIEEHEVRVLLMRKYNAIEELNDDEFCDVLPQFSTCKCTMDSDNMPI